ncbi:MAG: DNA helicase rad5 [Cirrosporium novae-zelandiae]|nr:MAG: DNA helicase rad5 [Cirrosporium novae-zelandiae]
MNPTDTDQPPTKKRRFFVGNESSIAEHEQPVAQPDLTLDEASPESAPTLPLLPNDKSQSPKPRELPIQPAPVVTNGFDVDVFKNVVGTDVSNQAIDTLQRISGGNLESAVNMYLDGSWKKAPPLPVSTPPPSADLNHLKRASNRTTNCKNGPIDVRGHDLDSYIAMRGNFMPSKRYVGAFGVEGWTTTSGTNLLKHEESVKIERTKIVAPTKVGRGGRNAASRRSDVIVRFTNSRDQEIGRFPQETAEWVSTLIDQKICTFEGACVYAPDRVRVNDTVYLQIKAFLRDQAFLHDMYVMPTDNNRTTGLFEEKESSEEKNLRLRQVAMVKLFDEINLHPTSANETTTRHKRQGLLKAAEMAEHYDKKKESSKNQSTDPTSSPPRSDEAEDTEGKELEQDQLDALYKKAQSFDFNTPQAEPAQSFAMDLRPYQKQALHWMMYKEKGNKPEHMEASMHPLWEEYAWPIKDADGNPLPEFRQDYFYVNPYSGEISLHFPTQEQNCLGGILADEMGLGKTIEMLSLIHTHQSEVASRISKNSSSVNMFSKISSRQAVIEPAPCTTLVIAPMSLLSQWESEAEKASAPGTMKTLVYYGNDKVANLQSLCSAANAANAPSLIITSYGVVLSEFNQIASNNSNRGVHGGLFSVEFFRIILDEAHHIKNRQSKTAKACYELSAKHRWVLTGTPIVNRLEDLFSLVRFLKVEPWSNFSFWKTFITVPFESGNFIRALDVVQTVLEPLVLRRTKDMKTPDGEALVPLPPRKIDIEEVELSKAEREVYDYIFMRAKRTFDNGIETGTLLKSYTTMFAQILRLRQSCCHPLLTRNKEFVASEEEAAANADRATGLFDDMDLQELIQRFEVEEGDHDANRYGAHVLRQIQEEEESECPICSEEPMIDRVVTGCWHSACKECLLNFIEHQKSKGEVPRCFNCREPINQRDIFEIIRRDPLSRSLSQPNNCSSTLMLTPPSSTPGGTPRISLRRVNASGGSAKIAALLSHLLRLRRESPRTKSVVFSQFTSFLDLIGPALTREDIPTLRFDGTMDQKSRASVLNRFRESEEACVLLLSLRAGGVGLNLTDAKRVFMMDPWWSWSVEAQAIDRVHRMGQDQEVKVVRFVVGGSIEGRMLKVQDRKKFIASSLGMMSAEEKKAGRIEDIRELLS